MKGFIVVELARQGGPAIINASDIVEISRIDFFLESDGSSVSGSKIRLRGTPKGGYDHLTRLDVWDLQRLLDAALGDPPPLITVPPLGSETNPLYVIQVEP